MRTRERARELLATAGLGLRLARTGRVRIALSVLLVALSMTVFLVVTQLGRIGSDGLERAIDDESGVRGSYAIETQTTYGLGREEFLHRAVARLSRLSSAPLEYVVGYPDVQPECPPFEAQGTQVVRFVYRADDSPAPLRFGRDVPERTRVCLAGAAVPASGILVASRAETGRWGEGLILRADYEHSAALMSAEPLAYRFVVTTGEPDSVPLIQDALRAEFATAATRFGTQVDDTTITVGRLDQGERVRAASAGIRTIFGVIGWGVLVLGALGLLVAQLIVVRERMWLFGLGSALGARRAHIAVLVCVEVLATVLAGVAVTVVLAVLADPLADDLARSTFRADADLLTPSSLPRLGLATLVLLVLASAWPAWRATTLDPLDVLEPKVG